MTATPPAADSPSVQNALLLKDFPQLSVIRQTPQTALMHTCIRDAKSPREEFVFYADRLMRLLVEEGLCKLPVAATTVVTPTEARYEGVVGAGRICGVSIMRAGESMESALRDTCRGVRIGKILIQRDETTGEPDPRYNYSKMPKDIKDRWVMLLDPMLATGGSAAQAVEVLKNKYEVPENRILFLNVVACPEGIRNFCTRFPQIQVVTTAIDDCLNEKKYIIPGLGDFGDRYFGTC